jgi:hypothetical protein
VTSLAEAAVLLAHRGYRVFPVGADKAPRTPNGHHDGTSDPETIRGWSWDGGIGLVIPDRVFVVDIDPRNGGDATMQAIYDVHGRLPHTRVVLTGGGGEHWYFSLPDDRELRGKLGPGVDIKKPGRGYVLVPPTPGYTYLRGGKPSPAPDWLLDELTLATRSTGGVSGGPKYFALMGGTGYGLATLRNALERIRNQGEGGRRALLNAEAYTLASLVAGGELDEDKALEGLLEAALESGLTEKDALSRIHSGWHAGLLNPRSAE